RSVKDELLLRKLVGAISSGVSVSPADIERAFKEKNTKVKFQYAVLSFDDITKQIKPTDAELNAFYKTNLPRYQNSIPEKRQVRYFVLQDKDAENKVTVDPAEISRYYSANQDQFRLPDRAKLRQIEIKVPPPGADGKQDAKAVETARKKAQDILTAVKSGQSF